MTLRRGSEIEVRVDRLAPTGEGVARHDARVVFVPLTAPGERVRVRIERIYARYARAGLVELIEPAPERVDPPCSYYGRCGGCSWMHLSETAQRAARERLVLDALQRIGHVRDLPTVTTLPSPVPLGYRSRARVACEGGRVGFRERGSRRVVDVDHCKVLDAETQRALERLRLHPPRHGKEVEIRGFGDKVEIDGGTMHVGPRAFFQANRPLWSAWRSAVVERCGTGRCLVELYAGVGFYTAPLTSRFDRVVAVERSPAAQDARVNTAAEVVRAEAEEWAPSHLPALDPEVVLANPPRAGCAPSVLESIREASPARIVYVSCDPATLARDVGRLSRNYRVIDLLVIDALPQTHHVEVVCVLHRPTVDISTKTVLTGREFDD